jgi:hypothetical protein
MNSFLKSILLCFGIDIDNNIKKEYKDFERYQPEGNRYIYNADL